jgi:hypothetical protein
MGSSKTGARKHERQGGTLQQQTPLRTKVTRVMVSAEHGWFSTKWRRYHVAWRLQEANFDGDIVRQGAEIQA